MIETRRRRELLALHTPKPTPKLAEAIIAADPLRGPDQDWKLFIDQTPTGTDPRIQSHAAPTSKRHRNERSRPPRPKHASLAAAMTKPNSPCSKPICKTSTGLDQGSRSFW